MGEVPEEVTEAPVEKFSPYVVGIDLGTTNSVIAVYKKGKPEILEADGRVFTPSVVSFRDDGTVLVGEPAKRRTLLDPKKTITSIKSEMAKPEWKFAHGGKEYTPTDIAAMILGKLKEGVRSQNKIDLEGTAEKAVICIPANFNSNKREETRRAGELVGLKVLHLLEEPQAAAIAYGFERNADTKLLIYDLGGGTFDVCILHVLASKDSSRPNEFRVLAKEGIPDLGGDKFDQRIMEMLGDTIKESSGIDVLDMKKDQGVGATKIKEAQQVLKDLAEKAKIELTEASSTWVEHPSVIKDESGKAHGLSQEISREQFEEITQDLILNSREAVDKALKAASLTIEDIDRIILVGGSTKMPMVKKMVEQMFQRETYADIDPVTIVAQGAAIYAASYSGVVGDGRGPGDIEIIDKVSHYLGIETYGREFNKLIDKDTDLTAEKSARATKTYQTAVDNQEWIRITIFQSPDEIKHIADPGAVCLGEFELGPIPKARAGEKKVDVTFEITSENLLKVGAVLKDESGLTGELEISRSA